MTPQTKTFVAFLRGVNVGGNKKVPMADLKRAFEKNGYTNVKTLLASGNVVFNAPQTKPAQLVKELEHLIKQKFGFDVPVITRTMEEIKELVDAAPFKKIKVTKDTRLYVTFLPEGSKAKITRAPKDANFDIHTAMDDCICSVVTVSASHGTLDLMDFLDAEFGKKVTIRNWNTVEKIAKLGS